MAQDEKTIVRSLLDPTIKIDKLVLDDLFTGTSDRGSIPGKQYQNELGVDYPFISINGYTFDSGEIQLFRIDATDFAPTVTFVFRLTKTDLFMSQAYPKDGDLLSVFIRAKNNVFKPIRNDYIIKNVQSSGGITENRGGTTTITGELFIPHIKDQIIKSYKGTSFSTLNSIAKDLGLGFATNETSTNDSQVWLCPNNTWEEYIKEICIASWKDENSFFKCFIDVYYHLNFINVNNQLEGDGQMGAGILDNTIMRDFYSNDVGSVESSQQSVRKFLTNIESAAGTNMYVQSYKTKNESSKIHEKYGYKYNVQFFDMKSLKYWNLAIDPKTSDGSETKKIILKGRVFPKKEDQKDINGRSPSQEEYWKTQNKFVWKGIQSSNVHDKYVYATAHNERNLLELKKLYIEADVERWNPNIYMGEKVPIALITQTDTAKAQLDAQGEDATIMEASDANPVVLDQFYSGYYMINGMKITFNADSSQKFFSDDPRGPTFYQTFIMTRREWPTPAG